MATLLLTAAGTALGGPIGGALGALAGHAIDAGVLHPATREGPRLTELKLQTSSYGTAIPKLFGTMRVAGTVIWSTDLIEHRSVAHAGKGQPGVAQYSYSASFAVLLSARPITGVARVWADGQLIRGAAGDWKVQTGFRVHLGREDQAADPLIAAAEGASLCPAHRGLAYAVFEEMALEQFGNRLPSLTFEVTADDGAVGVGVIAAGLAEEVTGGAALAVDGFAASGGSTAAVLATLAQASGAWFAPVGGGLAMRDAGDVGAPVAVTGQCGRGGGREIAAADAAPAVVTVSHYDPARDWQAGLQRAGRPQGGRPTLALEVPAAIDAGTAKGIAAAALLRAEQGRVRRTVPGTLDALALLPGDAVTLTGEAGVWRVEAVALDAGMTATLTLTPLPPAPVGADASAGRVMAQPDLPIGQTLLVAAELPPLDDALLTQPRLTVVATGEGAGWRAAPLLLSLDDGVSWTAAGATAAPGILGTIETALPAGQAALIDRDTVLTVVLARTDMTLADADAAALDRGANLALVGDELLQFARAEPLGGARWRLSELRRGRRATVTGAAAGACFALLTDDAARTIDLPLALLGASVRLMAAGVGDGIAPPVLTSPVTGASILPPAPVALRWTATDDGGAVVTWMRRSRAGWRWLDRVDAPLGEEREQYRATVAAGGTTREAITDTAAVAVTAAERAAGPVLVTVRQRGTFGESAAAAITI